MKKTLKIYTGIIALLILQSCGIVTKTRYGNGLKINLGSRLENEKQKTNHSFSKSNLKPQLTLTDYKHISIPLENIYQYPSIQYFTINKSKSLKTNSALKHPISCFPVLKGIKTHKKFKTIEPPKIKKKVEPHVKIGGFLFYGSLLGLIVLSYLPVFILVNLLVLALMAGIILTVVGKKFMKKNPDQFRGKGLMWSVLITCSLFLLLTFINLAFYIVAVA
jgi:hypothetical protein